MLLTNKHRGDLKVDLLQVDSAAKEQLLRVLTTSASKPSLQVKLIAFWKKNDNFHLLNPGGKVQRSLVCPQLVPFGSLQVELFFVYSFYSFYCTSLNHHKTTAVTNLMLIKP